MKTTIVIEHLNKADLSTILRKVSNDVSSGYTKSSGVLPAYKDVASQFLRGPIPACPPGYIISPAEKQNEDDEDFTSSYEFHTE